MINLQGTQATILSLFNFKNVYIRTFWVIAISFFMCFFAWFDIVLFMTDVVRDLRLTPNQKWNSIFIIGFIIMITRLIALAIKFLPENEKRNNVKISTPIQGNFEPIKS